MQRITFVGGPKCGTDTPATGDEYEGYGFIDVTQQEFGEVLHVYEYQGGKFWHQRSVRVARDEDCLGPAHSL